MCYNSLNFPYGDSEKFSNKQVKDLFHFNFKVNFVMLWKTFRPGKTFWLQCRRRFWYSVELHHIISRFQISDARFWKIPMQEGCVIILQKPHPSCRDTKSKKFQVSRLLCAINFEDINRFPGIEDKTFGLSGNFSVCQEIFQTV